MSFNQFRLSCASFPPGIALLAMLVLPFLASSQTENDAYPSVNLMSPNSTSLGKYIDHPVNLHTGVPMISIPIYDVEEGPLHLPISLSYHASGLKLQETASWVGAGWSLNAGGMVSRTVRGLPDEKVGWDNFSFYTHNGYSNYFMDENNKTDYRALLWGHKDGEPDLFFFNFGSYTGKFYFREDKTPVMIPDGDLKIEPYTKALNSYSVQDFIQGFKITAPDGTKYYFGVTPSTTDVDPVEKGAIKYGSDLAVYDKVISSWYLYKIESQDSKFVINISYRKEEYGYYGYSTAPCIPSCDNSINITKTIVFSVLPDQITCSNGKVTFLPSSLLREDLINSDAGPGETANQQGKALGEIKVESTNSTLCKSFKFYYGYFFSNTVLPQRLQNQGTFETDKKRLKLNSMQESDCSNSETKPAYKFSYYDENLVPRRLSFAQDHWGFNNGAESNKDLLPAINLLNTSVPAPSHGDNRDASWPAMRAGTLRSIQYPTGGGTEFIYEPNEVTTNQCRFNKTDQQAHAFHAGMITYEAGFGDPYTLTITQPTLYYYRLTSNSGGSGDFYVDNTSIATVAANETKEDYIFFPPGTYTLRGYANADQYTGVGVLVYLYSTTSTCIDIPKMVGGLRIKRMEQFGVGRTIRLLKKYQYDQAYLYSVPTYVFKLKNEIIASGILAGGTPGGCKNNGTWFEYYMSPVSTHPMQTVQGYHIGYGKVRETSPDGGYSVNEFKGSFVLPTAWYTLEDVCVRRINTAQCSNNDPIYPPAPLPYDFERGNPKSVAVFDNDNRKLTETIFTEEYRYNALGVFGVITRAYPSTGTSLSTHYDTRSGRLLWRRQVERIFNPLNVNEYRETESFTEFGSPYHNQVTLKTQKTNTGLIETKFRYAPDLTGCNSECPSCVNSYLSSAAAAKATYLDNITAACQFGSSVCNTFMGCDDNYNPCSDFMSCRVCAWTDYQYRLNELRKTYTQCLLNCNAANTCIATGKASSNADRKAVFIMEDQNMLRQPLEVTSWRDGKLLQASHNYYKPATANGTDLKLTNIYTTPLQDPATSFSPLAITTTGLVKDPKYSTTPEVTCVYDKGNIVQKTTREGITISYIWGYGGVVPIVRAEGVSYATLSAAYNADPVNFRNNPSIAGVRITTFQLDPVVGLVSVTDANGRKQSYEYDKLGRTFRLKDHDGNILDQFEYKYQVQ
jgi:YD repeat-containing protein